MYCYFEMYWYVYLLFRCLMHFLIGLLHARVLGLSAMWQSAYFAAKIINFETFSNDSSFPFPVIGSVPTSSSTNREKDHSSRRNLRKFIWKCRNAEEIWKLHRNLKFVTESWNLIWNLKFSRKFDQIWNVVDNSAKWRTPRRWDSEAMYIEYTDVSYAIRFISVEELYGILSGWDIPVYVRLAG